ncbi:MAG: ABC transporter permease [Xanthomonadales bacterium]|nr:ABC transporter permease [Xanthomonadales bacterium]
MLNWIAQIISVTRFNLLSLPQRLGSSTAAVFGIAGVVAVMVAVLSIAQGIMKTMDNSVDEDRVIVLRSGANTEMMSGLSGEDTDLVAEAPGLVRDEDGVLASPELFVVINLPMRGTGTDANVPMRGVQPQAFKIRDDFQIVQGRMFEPGLNEVIVGSGALREFEGLEVGSTIEVAREYWPVVGVFESGGSLAETEIWVDAAVLQQAYRRGNSFQAVYARLTSSDAFQQFKDALTADPRLNVKPMRESEYYSSQSSTVTGLINGLGTLIAVIMGLGAIFGALNTMYTAVASRSREIATLRALGFRSSPVVISVLAESLLLAFVGGAIGAGLAWLFFDGYRAATLNWESFSQIAFSFAVTPQLLMLGIFFAMFIGLLGGLLPAIRAARQPVATALREL